MKNISYLGFLSILAITPAFGAYDAEQFRNEIAEGVDLVGVRENIDKPDVAPGELGLDVYQTADAGYDADIQMFIPTPMYSHMFVPK